MMILAASILGLCDVGTEGSVTKILLFLARHQNEDGSWGRPPKDCTCRLAPPLYLALPVLPDLRTRRRFRELSEEMAADQAPDRERAQKEVVRLGIPVIPLLQETLLHSDPELKWRCHAALQELWKQDPAVTALFRSASVPLAEDAEIKASSLVLLTFLGAGYSHLSKDEHIDPLDPYRRYRFGEILKKGIRRFLERQNEDGSYSSNPATNALAALALSEYYGMTGWNDLKEPATRAVASVQASPSATPADALWKGMSFHGALLGDIPIPLWQRESMLLLLEGETSSLAVCGSLLLSRLTMRTETDFIKPFGRLDRRNLTPEERYLATIAVSRTWKRGTVERDSWGDALIQEWMPMQILEQECSRGSWSGSYERFEGRLITTAFAGLTAEQSQRYPNALFAGP